MERQQQALQDRLLAGQDRFHGEASAAYTQLAGSVDASLKQSLADGARAAGAALQPVAEAAMAGIAREAAALHENVARAVQRQLDGTASRFAEATGQVAASWQAAVEEQRIRNAAAAAELRAALDGFSHGFDERATTLVDRIAGRLDQSTAGLDAATGAVAVRWQTALIQHQAASDATVQQLRAALAGFAETFDNRSAALVDTVAARIDASVGQLAGGADALTAAWQQALAEHRRAGEATATQLRCALESFTDGFAQRSTALVDGLTAQLEGTTGQVADSWRQALEKQSAGAEALSAEARAALAAAAAAFEQQATAFASTLGQSHAALQERLAAQDEARLTRWAGTLQGVADTLRQQWQDGHAQDSARWQAQGDALARSVDELATRTHAQAEATVAEVARLVQVAAEAPRAAAEVIGELRQQLSDSMARDNTMLEERSRVLGTLSTLLDAVNHASTEQRGAIDALVNATSALLERAGNHFAQTVETQGSMLTDAAAQLTGSAVEVASLGEAFGAAVDRFGQSNEKLVAQLQRIETALGQSMARSDEQPAYYVAQAREVIDLSLSAQKQVIDELQQLADRRPAAAA
ncbi:MAG: hypothetical protein GAK38_03098 [Xylophilus sp.]|nr:MAG: hypothetical protein GAK38_03098 [Xylophilus sp.]